MISLKRGAYNFHNEIKPPLSHMNLFQLHGYCKKRGAGGELPENFEKKIHILKQIKAIW
jgi:hypothetical protein